MDRLDPVERRGGVGKLADAVVEHALALADAAEVEAQGGEAAPHEGLVEREHDRVVHRAAALRVRVEDQGDRRARARAGAETAFETALGPWKDDFGHCTCVWNIQRNARVNRVRAPYIGKRRRFRNLKGREPGAQTESISIMPRRRRSCPRRPTAIARRLRGLGQSLLGPCRRAAPPAPRWRMRGAGSRPRSAGTATLIFTSGATEAIEIVLRRAKAGPRIVSAIEHPAVLRARPTRAGSPVEARRHARPRRSRRGAGRGGAAAGRGPVGQQRDRRDPSDRRHRRAGAGRRAACCSPIARRAPASCRCPTPISSPSPRTSSAARRGSAPCWSGTSRRSRRSAARRAAIARAPPRCR